MTEVGRKKRRIARVGGLSSEKEAAKLHSDDGAMQADCNLVYNIMQSMNKTQDVMSYSQLQEHRSKEKAARTTNSDKISSNKQRMKINTKQMKKFVPEKSHPLMKKCQQSMKYIEKNMCIPKPRAHVGFIPRPAPNRGSNILSNNVVSDPNLANNKSLKESCKRMKHKPTNTYTKQSTYSEKMKIAKPSHSRDNSSDINPSSPKENIDEISRFINADTTDSDNEYEQFLQKHQPEKSARRCTEKSKKFKKKKIKKLKCAKKIAKVTSKVLSASEESTEQEIDCNENANIEKFPSQRIVDYENSDDSEADTYLNDIGTFHCDSFISSEDENIISKSSNEGNTIHMNDSTMLNAFQAERISITSSPAFSIERKDPLCDDALKSLCQIPCYVAIKRDPLLDKKVASLHCTNSVLSNAASTLNPDEDDCIIIENSINNFTNPVSGNIAPTPEDRNSSQGELTIISKSRVPKTSNMNDPQAKCVPNQEEIHSDVPKTDSIGMSAESFHCGGNLPLHTEKVSRIDTAAMKYLGETEGDECLSVYKGSGHSFKSRIAIGCEAKITSVEDSSSLQMSDSSNCGTKDSFKCDGTKENFNVQILSVKSLNDSDIIILSDIEEKDTEAVPTENETKETAQSEDSDVEIICLDSGVNKEKCANEGIGDVLNIGTRNEVEIGKGNSSKPSAQPTASIEDDCIILDDLDSTNEDICSPKDVREMHPSSQVVAAETNSNESAKSSDSALESEKNSILKILDTIDFNCIKKVLNETPTSETRKENIPAKVGHFTLENLETTLRTPNKLKQVQKEVGLSEKLASVDKTIGSDGPFDDNFKMSSTTSVDICEKRPNLVQNSKILHNKSVSVNTPRSPRRNCIPSNSCNEISIVHVNSSPTNSIVSEKGISAVCKTESCTSVDSPKNQPSFCTKVESYESSSDELDIIAAKSIRSLSDKQKDSLVPLLELYRNEYKRFMEIKCTEQNVTAGLKLLEDKQAKRLLAISSTIKNVVKKDECFHKINNEFRIKTFNKSGHEEKDVKIESRPSLDSCPDTEKDDKVKIFNKSVVERTSEILKSDGPSSSRKVYDRLVNSVCAECGKKAFTACSGCAKIYFCSEKCGLASWNKGHFATCRR